MKDRFLCIHGHFYQPPRENPWMEEIDPQESARPFPNWNERIYSECYLPNAKARVLNEKGQVVDVVNNFKNINFNFGPTLMAWLEFHRPDTYEDILAADSMSMAAHSGHGNAIAQVYNHMIMPLANRRDKITQVKWGIEDFRRRFKREPEAIWLAETACDEETLEVLVEHKMKYVILEPHQAEAVRRMGPHHHWVDVLAGQIDPKKPYRCHLKKDPSQFIDIFFYDGPISKAMGFEDVLFDAKRFMNRIKEAVPNDAHGPQLVSMATDGETFGHHKPFGDRVLAYLLNVEAPRQGFQITNYGEYLAHHPPQDEVRLKPGEDHQGTSWSCSHGVKRWTEHCGCRGGGPGEWTQHWRKPLRESLDWLRDETAKIFESVGSQYFKNPWEARDEYIHVILDRSPQKIEDFFHQQARRPLEKTEKVSGLKLLEMQRHAMLMYTSCGWFFTEISGIETVQVIQYAARALQLAQEISGAALQEEFLSRLAKAKSNIPEFKDGKVIYEKRVLPHIISFPHIASFHAICNLIDDGNQDLQLVGPHAYRVNVLHHRKEVFGDMSIDFGRMNIFSKITGEESDLVYMAVHMGLYDFRCYVKPFTNIEEMESVEKELFHSVHSQHVVETIRKIDSLFGGKYIALKDLPLRERIRIISFLTHEMLEKISAAHEQLYDENRRMNEIYRSIHLPIPEQLHYAANLTLKRRLAAAVRELADHGFNPKKASALQRVLDHAKAFEIELKTGEAAAFLTYELELRIRYLSEHLDLDALNECMNILKIAKKLKAELHVGRSQEYFFNLIKRWSVHPESIPSFAHENHASILQLLTELQIHAEDFKKIIQSAAK